MEDINFSGHRKPARNHDIDHSAEVLKRAYYWICDANLDRTVKDLSPDDLVFLYLGCTVCNLFVTAEDLTHEQVREAIGVGKALVSVGRY